MRRRSGNAGSFSPCSPLKWLLVSALCVGSSAGGVELSEIFIELQPFDTAAMPLMQHPIDFTEVLEIALDQNLDLELARAEAELARVRSHTAVSRLVPELELGAGAERTDGRVQGSFGTLRDVNFDSIQAGGSVR